MKISKIVKLDPKFIQTFDVLMPSLLNCLKVSPGLFSSNKISAKFIEFLKFPIAAQFFVDIKLKPHDSQVRSK